MLKIAYQIGVEAAIKEAAGEATVAEGLRTVGRGAWGGLKDFFSAAKIRNALKDIGAGTRVRVEKPVERVVQGKLTTLPEMVDMPKYHALMKALHPYLGVAGVGGAALGGPPLAKKVFPGLRGD